MCDIRYQEFYDAFDEFEDHFDEVLKIFETGSDKIKIFYGRKDIAERYKLMTRLAKSFMRIPLSSCNLERLFEKFKYNKTQSRNRMEQKILEAILLTNKIKN